MQFAKPPYKRYLLHDFNSERYCQYADKYSKYKKYGVRGVYLFLIGTGLYGVVLEFGKGKIVQYGKRRLASVVVLCAGYACAPAIAVITNAAKIVKGVKTAHTTLSYIGETAEDLSNVSFLPLDILLFGQPIPVGEPGRLNILSNMTDIFDG